MNAKEASGVMVLVAEQVEEAERVLARVPGFHSVRISARFKDGDGRKGVDIVLDSEGNLAVQLQSFTPRGNS